MSRSQSQVREKFFQDFASTTRSARALWAPGSQDSTGLPDLFLAGEGSEIGPVWMEDELPLPESEPVFSDAGEADGACDQLKEIFRHFYGEEGMAEAMGMR